MKRSTVDSNGAFLEDEMGCDVEEEQDSQVGPGASGSISMGFCEKKRRLSVEQVKALEKNFEVENKLEPERKVKLAMELGLQPRQVAVWFQNRRARWKTKQLERDYTSLKSRYESLQLSYDALRNDRDSLLTEIKELKVKLGVMKEEPFAAEEVIPEEQRNDEVGKDGEAREEQVPPELIYKDGSSDSDSSAIFNEESSPNHLAMSEDYRALQKEEEDQAFLIGFQQNQYNEEKGSSGFPFCYYSQRGEVEEHGLLGEVEPPSTVFFSDDSPAVPWYCSEQWS